MKRNCLRDENVKETHPAALQRAFPLVQLDAGLPVLPTEGPRTDARFKIIESVIGCMHKYIHTYISQNAIMCTDFCLFNIIVGTRY
jgi:hypothetical protein